MKSKRGKPSIAHDQAKQLLKVVAVLVRDESGMRYDEVVEQFTGYWRNTESAPKSKTEVTE